MVLKMEMSFFVGNKRMFFPDGSPFEGVGITPDVKIEPSVEDVRSGRDVVLDAARRLPITRYGEHHKPGATDCLSMPRVLAAKVHCCAVFGCFPSLHLIDSSPWGKYNFLFIYQSMRPAKESVNHLATLTPASAGTGEPGPAPASPSTQIRARVAAFARTSGTRHRPHFEPRPAAKGIIYNRT